MLPTKVTAGGEIRVVDSRNFPASKNFAAGLVRVKLGGMRELHWHPNAPEWQFYLRGSARMTVFMPVDNARTMDFHAKDVGFVPQVAGHYIENTGENDLVFLDVCRARTY
jgi:oxalate decarboxylase